MTVLYLNQGWADKLTENLSVKCDLNIKKNSISLKFQIVEPSVRAENCGFNQKVWEDSCVELFLSFDGSNYYNFEINCIGSVLGAYGPDRFSRQFIDPQILKLIEVLSSLGNKPIGIRNSVTNYEIEVLIPRQVFVFDNDPDLRKMSGNIYKCADRSPTPHYMYLYEIITEKPDFHRPEFFGKLF